MNFEGIVYNEDVSKFIEAEDDPNAAISLNKDLDFFRDENDYVKFVKKCEQLIRQSPDYSIFVRWVKDVVGINFCQVSSQIYDTDATIEMHHGPVFTLYDITSIILNDFMRTNRKINSVRIADKVISEHFDCKVQVVMLAITNHEAAHNRDLFLNIDQGVGDINRFIDYYKNSFDDIHKYKIWNYINLCKNNPSFDRGYLDIDHVSKVVKL